MGQHRTRKEKEQAQLHRVEKVAGLYTLNSSAQHAQTKKKNFDEESRSLIMKDLGKTFLVTLYVLTLLLILWWKLG